MADTRASVQLLETRCAGDGILERAEATDPVPYFRQIKGVLWFVAEMFTAEWVPGSVGREGKK
jgi:hypothetical protein